MVAGSSRYRARMATDVIVVSGAASGIGRAICELAADRGMTVGLLDADAERVEALATHLRASGARATRSRSTSRTGICSSARSPSCSSETEP